MNRVLHRRSLHEFHHGRINSGLPFLHGLRPLRDQLRMHRRHHVRVLRGHVDVLVGGLVVRGVAAVVVELHTDRARSRPVGGGRSGARAQSFIGAITSHLNASHAVYRQPVVLIE